MAFFCESFNRPTDSDAVIGFDNFYFPASGSFQIAGQASSPSACNWPCRSYWPTPTDSSDQVQSITINQLSPVPGPGSSYNFNTVRLWFRFSGFNPPSLSGYYVEYVWDHGVYKVVIARVINNAYSFLSSVPRMFSPGDVLRGVVEGNTISSYVNGSLIDSVTDSGIPTGLTVGSEYFLDCATPFSGIVVDNWSGGDLADESPCPPVIPPGPSFTLGRPLDCGHAFFANPCPKSCPELALIRAGIQTYDVAHQQMAFRGPCFPWLWWSGPGTRGR